MDEPWASWRRRSTTAMELATRWKEPGETADAQRDRLVTVLSRAQPRDCAAARFGCTRRLDRSCRAPEICSQERTDVADDQVHQDGQVRQVHRAGPLPGGCGSFYREDSSGRVRVDFSAHDRHRAVLWSGAWHGAKLWVDGVRVGGEHALDSSGRWLDDRFYTVQAEGPDDHPAQDYGMGELAGQIRSVLLHDAELLSTRLLVPGPDERWTYPWIVRDGESLLVYADNHDIAAGIPPHRVLRPE